jgi:hypothetical protein
VRIPNNIHRAIFAGSEYIASFDTLFPNIPTVVNQCRQFDMERYNVGPKANKNSGDRPEKNSSEP